MKRLLVALLAIVGGGIAAIAFMFGATAALVGILWLYVFGDDPWPAWIDPVLNAIIFGGGFLLWAFFAWAIWRQMIKRA